MARFGSRSWQRTRGHEGDNEGTCPPDTEGRTGTPLIRVSHVLRPMKQEEQGARAGSIPGAVLITGASSRARMPDKRQLALRQIDQARGDLYGLADDLEFSK